MRQLLSGRQRRGAAVVEFAVVAPVMFVVVLGAIEMFRLIMLGQLTESAAVKGSREAAKIATATASEVQSQVTSYLQSAGVPSGAVTVNVQPSSLSSLDAGADVTVTVQVSYAQVTWVPPAFVPSDAIIQASAVRTRE